MAAQTRNGVTEESAAPAPTCYKIHSREILQRSRWLSLVAALAVPIVAVAIGVFLPQTSEPAANNNATAAVAAADLQYFYENYKDDKVVVAGTVSLVLVFLYSCHYLFSTRKQIRDTELSVTFCPLGIQRCKTTTITSNNSKNNDNNQNQNRPRINVCNYPLVPMESVKDCILLEHVGGFSVATHVMIRVVAAKAGGRTTPSSNSEKAESELVSAFPDAILTFDQCHGLVHQMQRVLAEMR
mmetsp:Transcript_8123/g.17511  ORF Transcript_8123/g.17511 Transcript_8123/m.17511 type:complete len:241 (+) Transcript_8123:309-1031(+)